MGISWLTLVLLVTSLKGGPVRAIDGYLPQDRGIVDSGYDSLNVRFVGNWPFGPSYAVAVDEERELVYLGSGGGVYILDVSDPGSPEKVSELKTRGIVVGLFYDSSAEALYVADSGSGLRVIDMSDPGSSYEVGYYDTPGIALGVYVTGGYAYVADGDSGLRVIDVSDPSDPQEVGYYDTPEYAKGVYVVRGCAYVADNLGGLQIYQNLLYSVRENRVSEGLLDVTSLYDGGDVHLRFYLPEQSFVKLKVYDVLGRLVDYPLNGEMSPGQHDLIFRPEVKGVYFYRLETDRYVKRGKFLVF